MYTSLIIRNCSLIEVRLVDAPAVGQKIFFQDVPQLRGTVCTGIESFNALQLATSPNGNTLVPGLTGIALTLTVRDTEKFTQWPTFTMNATVNGGIIREIDRAPISLTKSYITILNITGLAINQAVCFNYYYERVR